MKIYVASSWRNNIQPRVVKALRDAGHEVYDFKNPAPGNNGFQWSEIDPNWQNWTPEQFREGLSHPTAEHGFGFDMAALESSEACVLVLPCGRSAHLEAGYSIGAGKPTIILLESGEPELMYKMTPYICLSIPEVIEALEDAAYKRPQPFPPWELKEYRDALLENPYFAMMVQSVQRGETSALKAISELSRQIKERDEAEIQRVLHSDKPPVLDGRP